MKTYNFFPVFILLVCLADTSFGQGQNRAAAATHQLRAARTTTVPIIDGALDEAAWQQATPVGDFIQTEPTEGQPATERTEVRILFDNRAIYVGVICYDSEPGHLVTTESRRDSSLSGQDSFQMILDTYHDRQNGFIFGTTPIGLQYDAQVRNEGETIRGGPPTGGTGGNQGGAGAGVNSNWDGSWEVKSRVTETGWTAEFMIPLRTLRYGPSPQTWGVNFQRNIERKRESVYWSPVSRIYSITRLSSAGELRSLELPSPRDFKLIPYGIASNTRNFTDASQSAYDGNADFGIDSKIGVTSSTTLDLTYNTDFAQVEVDEQQINLTRFNLLFPEKRPFFLENRGLFAVGRPGEIDLFFSRTIGISSDGRGTPIPIVAGARLTGKARGFNIGLLNMQTDEVDQSATTTLAGNNFTALRISRDLPNRSSVGVIAVNRVATGDAAGSDNWNRTFGGDARWGVSEALSLSGFVARTNTPTAARSEYAYSGAFDYRTRQWESQLSYGEVGDDFDPQVGFLERPEGYRTVSGALRRHVRTPALARHGIREWEPHASYESYWAFDRAVGQPDGYQETATLHVDSRLDFENGYSLGSTALNVQWEGLRKDFEVYPGVIVPAGDYRSPYFLTMGSTDRRKWISAGFSANIGGFLSGSQVSLTPSLSIRKEGVVTSTLRWAHNDIDLPEGKFTTNLVSARVTYNLSTLANISTLVQYNDRTKRHSYNIRFTWLRTAASGLYVVYNDTEGFDSAASGSFNGTGPVNRTFIIKYSHQIDVLD